MLYKPENLTEIKVPIIRIWELLLSGLCVGTDQTKCQWASADKNEQR